MPASNVPTGLSVDTAVARARQFSRYLERLLTAMPHLLDNIDLRAPCIVSNAIVAARPETKAALYHVLRQLRRRTMATLIVRDLAGWATLAEVTQALTLLAELAVQAALAWIPHEGSRSAGAPLNTLGEPQHLIVVGMGKLGGAELNVSSDIDLVFVYPEDGDTNGARALSNHEYFSRVGRALIAALSELTEDGFVFRVDMRLRPYGDSGPLAVSFDMLENYLVTQGREWERYAWIKARALSCVAAATDADPDVSHRPRAPIAGEADGSRAPYSSFVVASNTFASTNVSSRSRSSIPSLASMARISRARSRGTARLYGRSVAVSAS